MTRSAAQQGRGHVKAQAQHEHDDDAGDQARHRQRHIDLPESLHRRSAEIGSRPHIVGIDGAHRGIERQHHERQHDVHHADGSAREIVHERQWAVDEAQAGEPRVDKTAPLQEDEPRIATHQKRGPDREQHQEQQERGHAGPRLGDDVGQRISKSHTDGSDEEGERERALQRDQVARMQQSAVVDQGRAVGVAKRQPEQPGDGGKRNDADQQEAR